MNFKLQEFHTNTVVTTNLRCSKNLHPKQRKDDNKQKEQEQQAED